MTRLLALKKFIKILEKQLACAYLSFIPLLAAIPSATSLQYQKRVFERLLKDTSAAHLIEKLGESATISEDLLYQVMSFTQKYIYCGKTNEELVETRMRQYNTVKTKTIQTILPDPHSLKFEELTYKHTIGGIIQNITKQR